MAKWNMRDCDRKIHSAAFARGLTVTTEAKWGYTREMRGNMQATRGNKLGMWVNTSGTTVMWAMWVNILAKLESSTLAMWVNNAEKPD